MYQVYFVLIALPFRRKFINSKGALFIHYQVPKRQSKKQQLADADNEALIQIFHRPEQDSVNKAILEELQRIRVQLERSERGTTSGDDVDANSDYKLDKKNRQTLTNIESSQAKITLDTTQSIPKSVEEPEEELHLFDGEPNNAPWILDPDLGDGTVCYSLCFRCASNRAEISGFSCHLKCREICHLKCREIVCRVKLYALMVSSRGHSIVPVIIMHYQNRLLLLVTRLCNITHSKFTFDFY
jgi:hypothetical protein